MRLTQWSFHNISVPMLEDDSGELYCTSEVLCRALGINKSTLRMVAHRHADELSDLSVTKSDAKEFVQAHKEVLGVKRVRDDMRLWTEDDMITFAILSKSEVSKEFRRELRRFIKENARRGYVSQEEHQALAARLERLEEIVDLARPSLQSAASAAGAALWAQRGTKDIRQPN